MKNHDSDEEDPEDEESKFSIEENLREQCENLQNTDGLFNIEANNY